MILYCGNNGHSYGVVGTPTDLVDSNGNALHVGDVVILKEKDFPWSAMSFVAYDEEYDKFYIMGAYLGFPNSNVELAVSHSSLSQGFRLRGVCYADLNQ